MNGFRLTSDSGVLFLRAIRDQVRRGWTVLMTIFLASASVGCGPSYGELSGELLGSESESRKLQIVSENPELFLVESDSGDTLPILAAYDGYDQLLKECLQHGSIDLNAVNSSGTTALAAAVIKKNHYAFDLLIDHGVDVNAGRSSALRWAVVVKDADAVKRLLELGANPDLTSESGETPRSLAIEHGDEAILNHIGKHGKGSGQIHPVNDVSKKVYDDSLLPADDPVWKELDF